MVVLGHLDSARYHSDSLWWGGGGFVCVVFIIIIILLLFHLVLLWGARCSSVVRGTDFPFQIFPFSVSEFNKFLFFPFFILYFTDVFSITLSLSLSLSLSPLKPLA